MTGLQITLHIPPFIKRYLAQRSLICCNCCCLDSHMCVRACVRVYVCACERACVCVFHILMSHFDNSETDRKAVLRRKKMSCVMASYSQLDSISYSQLRGPPHLTSPCMQASRRLWYFTFLLSSLIFSSIINTIAGHI